MIRTILVDDEPMALVTLKYLLSSYPSVSIVGECCEAQQALKFCAAEHVDVVFLDIEMPGIKGVELAKRLRALRPDLTLVFVTAYGEYAVKAFEIDAQDYLLKPVTRDRLALTMSKIEQFRTEPPTDKQTSVEFLPVDGFIIGKASGRSYHLEIKDIFFLEVKDRHVLAATQQGFFRLQRTLGEWEKRLSKVDFCRCHISFIVNLKKIEYIEAFFKNAYIIKISDSEKMIPLSRNYAAKIKDGVSSR